MTRAASRCRDPESSGVFKKPAETHAALKDKGDPEEGCPSLQFFRDVLTAKHESLEPYRNRILLSIGAMIEVLLMPFTLYNLVQQAWVVAGILAVVQGILFVDLLALWQRRSPPVPPAVLLIPFVAGMSVALMAHGASVALWCHPVILFCYFILKRRAALWCSMAVLLTMCMVAFRYVGPELAWRLGVTLLLTLIMINVVLNVISDLHQHLARQTLIDPLTGCLNRRTLFDRLAVSMARFSRHGVPVSLQMIDVDHFKTVNDRFGHGTGDAVLKALVAQIGSRIRVEDALFRYGGEEFILLLENTSDLGATILAETIRSGVESAPLLDGLPVTVSIGVSAYRSGQSIDDWLSTTDEALYQAKHKGRNRVCCLPGSMAQVGPVLS